MNQSRIGVGSSSLSVDRSAGAFQVLGHPGLPVYFTSYFDETIGLDTYLPTTTPRPGHWGGIVYRNDLDNAEERFNYEREGIFLNYVNHADIRYGGGNVVVDSFKQIVTPIQMTEARPTISSNRITLQRRCAVVGGSRQLRGDQFPRAAVPAARGSSPRTIGRVGPEIHDNLLVENSSNGLFVRISTPAGDAQNQLTVAGRFDDTDVVHMLSENLRIAGKSGEPILELDAAAGERRDGGRPAPVGRWSRGTYRYKIVYVDANGFEGRPSEATAAVTARAAPIGRCGWTSCRRPRGDFVARRIYRSAGGVAGPYVFVAPDQHVGCGLHRHEIAGRLDANNTLQRDVPTVQGVSLTRVDRRRDAGGGQLQLPHHVLQFRAPASESPSSDPTVTRVLSASGQITAEQYRAARRRQRV